MIHAVLFRCGGVVMLGKGSGGCQHAGGGKQMIRLHGKTPWLTVGQQSNEFHCRPSGLRRMQFAAAEDLIGFLEQRNGTVFFGTPA